MAVTGSFRYIFGQTSAPDAGDAAGVGDIWINSSTGEVKRCTSTGPYTWKELAGAGDFFDAFRQLIPWVSLDGFTSTIDGAGGIDLNGASVKLRTDSVSGNKCCLRTSGTWYVLWSSGKKLTVEFPILHFLFNSSVTLLAHMTKSNAAPPSETAHHLGFRIVGADIYASNADGGVQKITDTGLNIGTGNQLTLLKFMFDPGVDCKFYVNNELKATHTQNLPTSGVEYYLSLAITTNAALLKTIDFGRILLEREL